MRTKTLGYSCCRNVKPVCLCSVIYGIHKRTTYQSLGLVPIRYQKWEREQIIFRVGIIKKPTPRTLQCACRNKIHELSLVSKYTTKKQLDPDLAICLFFKFLFKVKHRLASYSTLWLFIRIFKYVITVLITT